MLWRGLYEDYTPLNSWRPEGHVLWQTQIPKFELEPVTASHQLTGEHPTWKVHDLSYFRFIVVHVTVLALVLDLGKHKTSSQAVRGKQTFAETVLLCHFSSSTFRVSWEKQFLLVTRYHYWLDNISSTQYHRPSPSHQHVFIVGTLW